ncbi:MAG: DUF3768 domain-containing protein [Cohaesibacter sp.]|jgi:hypothetical protein|nr:DUF3768 domain-containing protein [Cohaesibacter sp.]
MSSKAEQIRKLNDTFRQSFMGGQIMITNGTDRLSPTAKLELFDAIKGYDAFTEDNDPYGEHDFGSLNFQGDRYFWKIDCYDNDMLYHSPDPANPKLTMRVLTIMMAEEY